MNRLKSILVVASLLIMTSVSGNIPSEILSGHYLRNCELLSYDMSFRKIFPGRYCLFLDNGSLISADSKALILYDKNQMPIWKIDGFFHH